MGWSVLGLFTLVSAGFGAVSVSATFPQSPNYRLDESTVGAGGVIQSNSTNYQSSTAASDIAVGEAASANYQIHSGSKTTNDPTLSFAIETAAPSFGSFSPSSTAVSTATFSVTNYTSHGYVVQIAGTPPTNGSHTLPPMTTTEPAQAGIEQFGINLVANTLPTSFGSNPDHGEFGVGSAAPNYGTPNEFRFVTGETIAVAPKSSGKTVYTLSYIANVDSLTPGGQYKSKQTIVVTGTY